MAETAMLIRGQGLGKRILQMSVFVIFNDRT